VVSDDFVEPSVSSSNFEVVPTDFSVVAGSISSTDELSKLIGGSFNEIQAADKDQNLYEFVHFEETLPLDYFKKIVTDKEVHLRKMANNNCRL